MTSSAGAKAHLLQYWSVLRRRRWLVYLSVATTTLIAVLGSFLMTPLYRASTTLRIERQMPDILSFKDLARVDYSWAGYEAFYETQYKILSSDAVTRRAARNLKLADHPRFAEERSSPGLVARLRALVPGTPPAQRSAEDLATAWIQGNLEVSPLMHSHLVRLSWVSPDPELARRICNAVASAYIDYNLESTYTTTEHAKDFLGNQVAELKHEIAEIEKQLSEYGESKRIVSADDASNITLNALTDIARRRTQARAELAEKEAAYRAVLESPPEALPEVMGSPVIAGLQEAYSTYEAEYSEKLERFKADWPAVRTLESKLERARQRLEAERKETARRVVQAAENDYRRAAKEVDNLEALLREQEQAAHTLKRDAQEYATLQSQVQRKRDTLDALLTRQNEMALSFRLKDLDDTTSNIRVVDEARAPTSPFRPNKRLNLALGVIVGLFLGIAGAFLLDHLDNTVASPADLASVVDLPVLAMVPRWEEVPRSSAVALAEGPDLVAHRDRHSTTAEAFRGLRTAILLSSPGRPPRQLVITSTHPEEGKSTTAANLAVVLSQLGRRVLLVDTDLRRPRLHKTFDLNNERGVSSYLSGLESDPVRLVQSSRVEGLDVMTSGPLPPNPSELLDSTVFAEMGRRFVEAGYDHLVYDSPPLLSVADPVIIASAMDGTILVVRAHRTARESVRLALDKLAQSGATPSGAVINDLDPGASPYARAYYGSYRGAQEAESASRDGGTPPRESAVSSRRLRA